MLLFCVTVPGIHSLLCGRLRGKRALREGRLELALAPLQCLTASLEQSGSGSIMTGPRQVPVALGPLDLRHVPSGTLSAGDEVGCKPVQAAPRLCARACTPGRGRWGSVATVGAECMLYCLLTVSHVTPHLPRTRNPYRKESRGLAAITPQPNPPPLPLADCLRFLPLQHPSHCMTRRGPARGTRCTGSLGVPAPLWPKASEPAISGMPFMYGALKPLANACACGG